MRKTIIGTESKTESKAERREAKSAYSYQDQHKKKRDATYKAQGHNVGVTSSRPRRQAAKNASIIMELASMDFDA